MTIGATQYIQDTNTSTLTSSFTFPQAGTAVLTLVANDASVQFLDPGGAGRTVVLPALADGLRVVIANRADATEVITINDAAGATIATPTQNETASLWCDGTNWAGSVGDDA